MPYPYDVNPQAFLQSMLAQPPTVRPHFASATPGGLSFGGGLQMGNTNLPAATLAAHQPSQPARPTAQPMGYYGPTHQAISEALQGALARMANYQGPASSPQQGLLSPYTPKSGMANPYAVDWFPKGNDDAAAAAAAAQANAARILPFNPLDVLLALQGGATGEGDGNGAGGGVGTAAGAAAAGAVGGNSGSDASNGGPL